MRTKTLLLSAAVGAAGMLAASAQVYSVNSVGYVNKDLLPGFNLVANQLTSNLSKISDIMPAPPLGTQVLTWNGTGFTPYTYADPIGIGASWIPNGDLALTPGMAVFINNPTASPITITFVGDVPQAADSNMTIPAGVNMMASKVPTGGNLVQAAPNGMGMPFVLGDQVLKWNNTNGGYDPFSYADPIGLGASWIPGEPSVVVGEGFFYIKVSAQAWDRNFSVN